MKVTTLFGSVISGEGTGWKLSVIMLLSAFVACPLRAQAPPPEPPAAPPQSAPQQLSQEELNRLLAPIALYPDALIAIILPASTVPSDLVLAERYIASNGDPGQIADQPWDDSVKSLVRYPDVLKWMDQNLEWTTALGGAFLDQPADVMNSIQALRAEAIAAGNLTDTPQQRVVREKTCVRIVPAEPDVIYVPQYDPEVVYVQPYSEDFGPLLTFSAGFAVGSWLNYDCDWDRRGIYVGQWRPGWNQNRNWDRWDQGRNWDRGDREPNWDRWSEGPERDRGDRGRNWDRGGRGQNNGLVNVVNINSDTARQWKPSASSQRRQAQHQRSNRANARLSSVNALDANPQSSGESAPSIARGVRWRANHIPKPSRADFTSQTNERIRRNSQDSNASNASRGFPPSPNVDPNNAEVSNAKPGGRGKNHKVAAPSVAPSVPGEQGAPPQGGGQGNPRNLNKHARGGDQNLAANTAGVANAAPGGRGKNHKVPAPSVAPSVPGEQGAPPQGGGQGGNPRNLNKHARGGDQNLAANAAGVADAAPGGRGKNHKVPASSTITPNVPGEQGAPPKGGGQKSAPRNLTKHAQGGHHSTGRVNNQPPASPYSVSTQKHQKHVDRSQSSSPHLNNAPRPSNGQKHQQEHAAQSAPSRAKQSKPSQPPPAAAHQGKHSQRSAAAAHQKTAPQASNAPQGKGKGKGGGEKKPHEKKNKDGT